LVLPRSKIPNEAPALKRPTDPVRFRESLLPLLQSAPGDEDRLITRFQETHRGDLPLYSSLLYLLAHLNFSEAEARRHWERIGAHRQELSAALGRDPGLRVALLDYFVNVSQELESPKVIEIAIYQRTERDAVTDGLTGLFNHAYLLQTLRREMSRARRHDLKLSLLIFDLDDFKKINDTRGHPAGDRVLVKAAALISDSLREIDLAARYGGEEFAVVLPETARAGAHLVANRIRERIETYFRRRRGMSPVTISGGVATYPEDASTVEELVRRADEGLYRSKAAGKNRITVVGRERRRHRRVPLRHPVVVRARRGRATARARNVSEGGLLVNLRSPVPLGSRVSLVVRPPGGAAVGLKGEVVRVKEIQGRSAEEGYDVGVKLLNDPTETRALVLHRGGRSGPR
jgi:diguanylate cyclase (GGDEF)-like protein